MKTNTKFLLGSLAIILGLNPIIQAQTVTIGTQVWTTKNLDVSTFRNGDVIPQASTDEAWKAAGENKQPAWCYYDNDPKNGTKYGKLYNWYAVNDPRGLAPAGYHIPTDAEWTVLTDYLGGEAGKKMKSTTGWDSYTTGGSKTCPNCKDWNAEYRKKVPCHTCKDTRSVPGYVGKFGYWWSASEYDPYLAWFRYLYYPNDNVNRNGDNKERGLSVRCLRD